MFAKLLLLGFICIVLFMSSVKDTALAQSTVVWSAAKQIPGYPSKTDPPYLVADNNKTVHAFHVQPVKGQPSIVYSNWTMARGWSVPIDVLLPPESANTLILGNVFLDKLGFFHVIFFAGDAVLNTGDIFYAKAPAIEAGRTSSWSSPKLVAERTIFMPPALTGGDAGDLFVFFSTKRPENGLYEVYSRDGGENWSDPTPIFTTSDDTTYPGDITLLMGQGDIHMAWTVWRPPYGGEQLYYARYDTEKNTTTAPILLSRPTSGKLYLPGAPSLAMLKGTLYLAYQEISDLAGESMVKLIRHSADGGRSWTKPIWGFPPLIGGNGAATLLVDSANRMHAVLANRAGDCCHGMWYSAWEQDHWSEPEAIIKPGPKTPLFDPQIPQTVISHGNVILTTWINEEKYNGVMYSYAKLDVGELPVVALPTTTSTSAVNGSQVPISTATSEIPFHAALNPTKSPDLENISVDGPALVAGSPSSTILIGVIPVLAIIAFLILLRGRM